MDNWGWIIAGGAAATGVLTAFWGYLRSFWSQIASRAIVTCEVFGDMEEVVTAYLWRNFCPSPFGSRSYVGWTMFVRPVKRVQLIAMEMVGMSGRLYWRGWRPIWVSRGSNYTEFSTKHGRTATNKGVRLSYIRGMFDADQLILEATKEHNHWRAATDNDSQRRYRVQQIFGTAGKPASHDNAGPAANSEGNCAAAIDTSYNPLSSFQNRILHWQPDDLGTCCANHGNALGQLALSPEAEAIVAEVRRWKTSEDWYKERGIPWRRSCLLHGKPGTGKTSFIRAVAEDFDLPVWVYNLSTLYNNELQSAWQKMLANVPCVALIEDIDAVFHGRENKAGGHLSFDCLLNCLDGIERADGVLLVVTTNHLEKLDPALTRPGRLDRVLEMRDLDAIGRQKLCRRILHEWPEVWDEVVAAGQHETGAEFQERCTRVALDRYWNSSDRENEPCRT